MPASIIVLLLFQYPSIPTLMLPLLPALYSINHNVWIAFAVLIFLIPFVNFHSGLNALNINVDTSTEKQDIYIDNIVNVPISRRNLQYMLMMLNTPVIIYYLQSIYQVNPCIYLVVKLHSALFHLLKKRFWPSLAFCVLLAGICFFFLPISQLVKLQYYAF